MYMRFCEEEDLTPLSKASLFRILSACSAAKRSNLSGLDNISADGSAALDNLLETLQKLEHTTVNQDIDMDELTKSIKSLKLHFKTNYKFDITRSSICRDNCIEFSLSSPKDILLAEKCSHDHNTFCTICSFLDDIGEKILDSIQNIDNEDVKEDLHASTSLDIEKIREWKAHILRTKNQDEARLQLMDSLERHQILIVMDWAMKFLPLRYREKQSDFLVKKGLNWHVSVAIFRANDGSLQHKTFVHLFNGVRQDWFAVASIIENTLMNIRKQIPDIEEVFLRSDNAGCYHCGCLWLSLCGISQRTGLNILRYDYSEAQSGKSFCDAKIAHMRTKMKMYVAQGNNIASAEDMQAAIMSGTGVTGCQCAVADIDTSKQSMTGHNIKGVNAISNLEFRDHEIVVWLSFNIGIGKKIDRFSVLKQEQGITGLDVISDFAEPRTSFGSINVRPNQLDISNKDQVLFYCTEVGCSASFPLLRDLECHINMERHQCDNLSTFDKVRQRWAETCNANLNATVHMPSNESIANCSMSPQVEHVEGKKGWALRKDRKFVRFSAAAKEFLKKEFDEGERSGKKVNPITTSRKMRAEEMNGVRVFRINEVLQPSQIASYFARLSIANGRPQVNQQITEVNDEDLLNVVRELEENEIREELIG